MHIRCFYCGGHTVSMPPLSVSVLGTFLTEGTRADSLGGLFISSGFLIIAQEELESVAAEMDIWISFLELLYS